MCSYVPTCFTCLLCSHILHAYNLVCFFNIVCPIFFALEKLTSKNPYIEKFQSSKKYLEPTWTSKKEFFAKRLKAFHYFCKKVKKHRFSKISSFLFPAVNKRAHKPYFWQHPLARIFINILYYLNSHNHKKKTFFSCNYRIIVISCNYRISVCLEISIQIISIDNSNKFINIIS